MKNCLFFLLLLPLLALSQTEKGVSLIPQYLNTSIPNTGSTYAVVVGISDYQDEGIPDLRFADKDALAFAGFLQSPSGGGLDEDHLKVLINEKATQAQFAATLDWLWEVAEENDKVIIYFSGHGDVERKSFTQPGYLLCWDAPPNVYMGGGAFNVRDLNDVVSTISIQNKAKVILVTDACRAGKLSGSNIGGSQATAANLAKQYGNEIKILSCQPDEYSIEGEQWGGGRGAFSYHLLDGLYGMADGNDDQSVNLLEIGRYLEDHVSTEVAPQSQIPMTVGGRGEKLTTVFPEILKQLKEDKKGQIQLFAATESKGIEDDILAAADSNIVEMYLAFQKTMEEKQFLEPVGACTDFYYELLSKEPQLKGLYSSMRRNYAVALQDDIQQALNLWMKADNRITGQSRIEQINRYKHQPDYLQRAAELLGKEHYMYPVLQARKLAFEGYLMHIEYYNPDPQLGEKILAIYRESLQWQPESPIVYAAMGMVQFFQMLKPDSADYFVHRATELVPSWTLPYDLASYMYIVHPMLANMDKARHFLELVDQIDSMAIHTNFLHMNSWAIYFRRTKQFTEAEQLFKRVISLDSTYRPAYGNLGNVYLETRRYKEAEQAYKKVIQLAPGAGAYINLGNVYSETQRYKEAEQAYKKAIQLDSTNWMIYGNLGWVYQNLQRWEESEAMLLKAIHFGPPFGKLVALLGNAYTHLPGRLEDAKTELDKSLEMSPDKPYAFIYLAQWSLQMNQTDQAWQYLEQGLEKGFGKGELKLFELQKEPDFAEMRKDARWGELMKRYFPEEFKD